MDKKKLITKCVYIPLHTEEGEETPLCPMGQGKAQMCQEVTRDFLLEQRKLYDNEMEATFTRNWHAVL